MIVLDENILESQRAELASRRIRLCQIGFDVGRKGMQDDEIIVLLRQLRRPTFFSRDRHFFRKELRSDRFCLAQLGVGPLAVAELIRAFLRHPEFHTWTQRRGCVARLSTTGIVAWQPQAARATRYRWPNRP